MSVANGNWSDTNTWNTSADNGATWGAAITVPDQTSSGIFITNGFTVTVDVASTASVLSIDTGSKLVLAAQLNAGAYSASIVVNGTLENALSSPTSQTFSGLISGSGVVTNSGTGVLTLSGANTYSGDTTISAGALALGANNVIPDGAGKGNVLLNPASGTATLDLNGKIETINSLSSSGAGSSVVDNTLASSSATLTVGNNDATSTFGGVIQNSGSGASLALSKTGTGTLTLTGNNSYSGNTSVTGGGTLQIGNGGTSGTLGTNALDVNGSSTLVLNRADGGSVNSRVRFGLSSGNNNLHVVAGTWDINADPNNIDARNTTTYTVDAGATVNINTNGSGDNIGVSGANMFLVLDGAGTGVINRLIGKGGAANSLIKNGVGTWTLTPAYNGGNGWTVGGLTISNGVLAAGADNAIPWGNSRGDVTVVSPGILDLSSGSVNINGLGGDGTVRNAGATARTLTLGNANSNGVFNGVIQNTGSGVLSLTKTGTGTQTLAGANTYTGDTVINGGTLALSGSGSIASTPSIAVAVGAGFDVSGVSGGSYALNGAGVLSLDVNKSGATYTQGQVVIAANNLALGGGLTVSASGDALASGDSFTLVSKTSGALSGAFSTVNLPVLASGLAWDTNNLATTGVLDVYNFSTTPLTIKMLSNTVASVSATKMATHASSSKAAAVAISASTPANGTASVTAGALTYTPNTGYTGSDSFTVTYSDGHGVQTMSVSVTVSAANVGPSLSAVDNGSGFGSFVASAIPSTTYVVQMSTNLISWLDYDATTAAANGVISYTDPVSIVAHGGTVYYRLKQ